MYPYREIHDYEDILKGPRGIISIWVFSFVTKHCIPQIRIFKIYRFKKTFCINISKNPEKTQTNYLYTYRIVEC